MTPHARRTTGAADFSALATVTIWGTSFALQKIALSQFSVLALMPLRYLGMLILSWTVLVCVRRSGDRGAGVRRRDLGGLALAGCLGYTLYIPIATLGLNHTTPFSNALLLATAPAFAALLLRLRRLEAVGVRHWTGLALSLAGVALFVTPAMRGTTAGTGDGLTLVAALFFAAYTVATKPLLARYRPVAVTAYTMTFGAVPVIVAALPALMRQDWSRVTPAGWGAFAWTVVMPVYVAWTLWSWTVERIGVARASLFMYLVPIVGAVASHLIIGEQFDAMEILGAAVTLAGLAVGRRTDPPAAAIRASAPEVDGDPGDRAYGSRRVSIATSADTPTGKCMPASAPGSSAIHTGTS